jgi:thiol-disulfide isomerase/thioredoxin
VATSSSTDLALGSSLPPVRLPNAVDGAVVDLRELSSGKRGALVMFLCNHCPYVVHVRKHLARAANDAVERGFAVVAINSNDLEAYPQDGPEAMARMAREDAWRFPFLFDQAQDVARAFRAECTPDLYVFDSAGRLAYHGQFDDSRPANGKPLTGHDLKAAIEAVSSGRSPATEQKPSIGCSIKWSASR